MAFLKHWIMQRKVLFFFLMLGLNALLAQQGYQTREQLPSRDAKTYEEAEVAVQMQEFPRADMLFSKVLERNPQNINALLARGSVREYTGRYAEAEADYAAAVQLAPDFNPNMYFLLAFTQRRNGKYREAAGNFEIFLEKATADNRLRPEAERGLTHSRVAAELVAKPVPFQPERLPVAINSPEWEYLPSLTADGRTMIFTRRVRSNEDFYVSTYEEEVGWTPAEPMAGINTDENEGAQTLSADGRLLIFTGCNRPGGRGSCALYLSELRDGRWTPPANLNAPINTAGWESHPSLSGNGRLLFFSSDRPGGQGKSDLWASARRPDGGWTNPINLGAVVNTAGQEEFPFFHPDGKTLYFSSDGHPGMGGKDIFYTQLDTNQIWGEPVNLGYPINTASDENSLVISLDGRTAYFASDQRPEGSETAPRGERTTDLFSFELPEAVRPEPVTYVSAEVVDAFTGQAIAQALVELSILENQQVTERRRTNEDGRFLLVLPAGETYALAVDQPGYLFYSDQFALGEGYSIAEPYNLRIELQPIAGALGKEPIVLKNILFATGSAELLPPSVAELERLRKLLADNPALHVRINGHTDNVGGDAANQVLSENRAKAVYSYLVEKGIAADRLSYKGFGESKPVTANETPEGRAKNRRTEFEVVE